MDYGFLYFYCYAVSAINIKKAKRQNLLDANDLHGQYRKHCIFLDRRHCDGLILLGDDADTLTTIGIKCSCLGCCGAIKVLSLLNHRITWLLS